MPTNDPVADDEQRQRLEEALKNCASEPIQLAGAIQPLGVLVALDEHDLRICHVSANVGELFSFAPEDLPGKPFSVLVGDEQADGLRKLIGLEDWRPAAVTAFKITRDGRTEEFDAQVSKLNGLWIVEIECQERGNDDLFHRLFIPIRDALWQLDAEKDLRRYTQQVVDQVRLLTGYDRVMMYQFDSNWDGEVIAESRAQEMISYLGNRFPASDIPPQARQLYTRNLVRLISDVESQAIPVIPILHPGSGQPLDMTYSALRHFSPVHLEYLRNMGVRATLTISLIQNGHLWGLIACHHMSPKYIPLRVRELDEFIGKTVSLKLSNLENNRKTAFYEQIRLLLEHLTEQIRKTRDVPTIIDMFQAELLSLVRANSAVLSIEGRRYHLGDSLPDREMDQLESWLRSIPPEGGVHAGVFHTENLSGLYPPASAYQDTASGLMLAPLDGELASYIAWFRCGMVRTLKWAGSPEKVFKDEHGKHRISPRESFETWVQTFRDKSPAWSQIEIDAASSLSLAVIEVLTHRALELSEENYRLLAEYSTDMIARLDVAGSYTFVSPASAALLGLPPESIIGQPFWRFVLPDDEKRIRDVIEALGDHTRPETALFRVRKPDQSVVWIEATLKRMQKDPEPVEIVVNARDVTQRHTYQLAIEDLHRRNAMILDSAGDGVISFDREGKVVYVNGRAGVILGHDPRSMIGYSCCELIRPHDAAGEPYDEATCPLLAAIRHAESVQDAKEYFLHQDGHRIPVEYICTPMMDNGASSGSVLVFNEHAERQRISEQTRTTDVIMNQATEAMMVTDPGGRILSVNPAFTAITGYGVDEAIGATPKLLKSGVHTPNFYDELWAALADRRYWTGEIWNRRKNGEIYPQWGSITAIMDETGAVRNYVAVFSDISKAKQAEERLYYLANHDTLTGLPNRIRFTEHVAQSIDRARRRAGRLGVAFVDIDRFKIVNDTLGHATGDQYLRSIATRISAACRQHDLVSRWGGDEFVLALEDISGHDSALDTVQRIVEAVSQPLNVDGHELHPTVSVGISLFPDDAANATDLIKAADAAMYRVKDRGRNGFEFYTAHMADEVKKKFEIVSELNRAFRNNELVLHYQPQVESLSGRVVGLEALVRWQHPERGLLGPVTFIPLAEDLGLIGQLGEWVLQDACRQIAQWQKEGVACPKVAVNVSPAQLKSALPDFVALMLETYVVPASLLELEITEGALEQGTQVLPVLQRLRDMGISLSIDDFGTGYSSLSHLKNFPISCFKIDKSFVDGIIGNTQDLAIVKTIMALGDSLKVSIVAEGVEHAEQYEMLKSLGPVVIQGFYFSKPVPADECARKLKTEWRAKEAAAG